MKLAIALQGKNLTQRLDDRFGRSKYFCIYNSNSKTSNFIENIYAKEKDGVGRQVVDLLAEQGVQMIIASEFGPKVRSLLEKMKIQMVIIQDVSLTGDEILKKILKNYPL